MAHRNFARTMRRKTQWAGSALPDGTVGLSPFVTVVAPGAVILSQRMTINNAIGFDDEEVTLTRTIGRIMAGVTATTANIEGQVAIGLAVASLEALAAGAASLPIPETRPDFEWIMWKVLSCRNGPGGTANGGTPLSQAFYDFDVKSQRIIRSGHSLVWIAASSSTTMTVNVNSRYLLKLP